MGDEESTCPEYLINQSTYTCLSVLSGTGVHDAVIGMAKCSGDVRQQWYAKNNQWQWGGNRLLCLFKDNATGKLCLVPFKSASGTWDHDQEERLILGSQALDVPWERPRTQIIFYSKHHYVNQKWWTLSKLKACIGDDHLIGEHCVPPKVLDICKAELGRSLSKEVTRQKKCYCQGDALSSDRHTLSPEYLISQSTRTCLTVMNSNCPDETSIELSPFTGDLNQQWIIGGKHEWCWAGNQSYCLGTDCRNGTLKLVEVQRSKTPWKFDKEGFFGTGSNVLDVPWEVPRTRVIVYPKHGGENQQWWKLSDVRSALCENPEMKTNFPKDLLKMATTPVVPCQITGYQCQCQDENLQDVSVTGEAEYLISQSTHTCLTVQIGTSPSDATIGLAPYTGNTEQQWYVRGGMWQWGSDRSYCLAPDLNKGCLCLKLNVDANTSWTLDKAGLFVNGSYALDVPWKRPRKEVILYPKHGGINQKWWTLSSLKLCIGRRMYPFPAEDGQTFLQELARGIVNRLCPLSECLPYPRDIGHYPGTVADTTTRVNFSCILNVGRVQQANNLRITLPEDWQATNMSVAAGDIFTVILPDTLTKTQADQITVRVGAQRDCLDPDSPNLKNGNFKRIPVVSEEFDLNPGSNQFRSQFGGNLIFTYEGRESFSVTANIKNVIETPHYVLGMTKTTDWERMKHLDAPFSILETEKVVLVVPTSGARGISNLDSLLHRYDDIIKKLEDLSGFTEKDPSPQGKQWLVDDVQITAGSAHAGFPAMFDHQYYDLTSPETPHEWVVWHELGHNYQQGPFWSYAYGSESTVNLFSLYIQEKLKADDRLKKERRYIKTAKAVDNALTFEAADCWQKLVFLMEIKHAFAKQGWDMYRHLNSTVRALSDSEAKALGSSKQKQYDYVYKTLSIYINVDLIPHYERWGLPISKQVQDEVKSHGLPKAPRNLSANCQ